MTALTMISIVLAAASDPAGRPQVSSFQLISEFSLEPYGGIPFPVDLNGDGCAEILWLQSPGLFHSKVFDVAPWQGQFSEAERGHFCLTATDARGKVLWQVGQPWAGERPFVTHCAERALDTADIDGDGTVEVACVRRNELLVLDGRTGVTKSAVPVPADNGQIVRIARTGRSGPAGWTVLVKNSERAYPPHQYANPAWFYNSRLELIRTADYLGAGHAPQTCDLDRDGLDEFVIGFNVVDHKLNTRWTYETVPASQWDAAEMHVDCIAVGKVVRRLCIALAASDKLYLLDARTGQLVWKRTGEHPQFCLIGHFHPGIRGNQVFLHNKRASLQLFDRKGRELWSMKPPVNFPLGQAEPCRRQAFHMFDPLTILPGAGPAGTDLVIFTDGGWPYVIDGLGRRCLEFPYTANAAQDWGEVPGRPDDYGYGYYARVADLDDDGAPEVLISDRRFAWIYKVGHDTPARVTPRSDGRVLHIDFENYVDGVVQVLNAGVRWLGHPFANLNEGLAEVTQGFAFSGSRCGHIETKEAAKISRIRLQRRFNAPVVDGDTVIELMFRAVESGAADLRDIAVIYPVHPAGLALLANGDAHSGLYRLDVLHRAAAGGAEPARADAAVTGLRQDEWTHVVLHRRSAQGSVDLWVGAAGRETHVGTYPDLHPKAGMIALDIGDRTQEECQGSGFWDDIRIGAPLQDGQSVAPPEPRLRNLQEETLDIAYPIPIDRRRQLFVDDVVVEAIGNLRRTLHPASRHPGNPLLKPETPWEKDGVFLVPLSVLREQPGGKLRMWYGSYRKTPPKFSYTCLAESVDGIQWTRPSCGLVDFEGSKANNIVWEGRTVRVNYDPEDPDPSRRYKGMMRTDAFTPLFSPDGIQWTIAPNPVISQAYDASSTHWDPITKTWIFSCKVFRDGKRARGCAESKDFVNWSDTCLMLSADEKDAPQDHLYSLRIHPYESIFLGMLKVYHLDTDRCDVQLAFSRDARHWQRPFRTSFIPLSSDPQACDYANLDDASEPIQVGDDLWFYYGGRNSLHNVSPTDTDGALCLATLRREGFVSVDAGPEEGFLLTKPLILDGDRLFLNADAREGEIRVAVIEERHGHEPNQAPVAGNLDSERCLPVTGDSVRHPVAWTSSPDLGVVRGRTVRLRFSLRNASLYSFWVE